MKRHWIVPLLVVASACIISRGVTVSRVERPTQDGDTLVVRTPVKAHLIDGSSVLFRRGIEISRDRVWSVGGGMWYDVTRRDSAVVAAVPMDSVVGIETYQTHVNPVQTIVYSTLTQAVIVVGAFAIACAMDPKCFGSCPTFYADSAGTPVLEAEGFSYSIAQLFEARDVDRLRFPPDANGVLRLEVRNEAFETHFINHLELLEVRHGPDEVALPDERNQPFVVAQVTPPIRAVNRIGQDVRRRLADADGDAYRTPGSVLAQAGGNDTDDWIDLTIQPPVGDSIALVFRLRNSLLNTILLYDIMLGDPGARSLDWVGHDLGQVGPAVELAQWYQRRMGMNVAVLDHGTWRTVAHLKDTGPVAWKDVAIVVPVLDPNRVRIRLRFPADNWRIDRLAVARRFRRLPHGPTVHRLSIVRDALGRVDSAAAASMAAADDRYLEVESGRFLTAEFQAGAPLAGDSMRTFFLGSQGYYTEWVRNGWLRAPRANRTFTPSDTALVEAIHRWRTTQDTLEARFMATRVPVR